MIDPIFGTLEDFDALLAQKMYLVFMALRALTTRTAITRDVKSTSADALHRGFNVIGEPNDVIDDNDVELDNSCFLRTPASPPLLHAWHRHYHRYCSCGVSLM